MNSPNAPSVRFTQFAGHPMHSPVSRPDSVGSVHSTASDSASSGVSAGRGPKRGQDICVSEELKIAIDHAFERFKGSSPDDYHEMEFPTSLTSTERAYIHRLAAANNFKSKSRGKNSSRYITVIRQQAVENSESVILEVTLNSQQQLLALQKYPLTNKEKLDLTPRTEKGQQSHDKGELNKLTTGKLNNGLPQVPPKRSSPVDVQISRLPVEDVREEIIHNIATNQVVLLSGETGCGKTTQVPQMILDSCSGSRLPCRIICTQPRRLAALSVAERVASERGEKVGQTVGYQIRLESKVSPKTLLTYCTNGVLLRTLIGGDNALATVTHIVVDELHERDRLCDFLLIILKQAICQYKNLKVVLMSATLDTDLFLKYFSPCPLIQVPGFLFDVEEFYLEDVLRITGYMTKKMKACKRQLEKLAQNEGTLPADLGADDTEHGIMHKMDDENMAAGNETAQLEANPAEVLDPVTAKEMDKLITDVWMTGNEDLFPQIYHFILSEDVNADYQHSETGVTALMAACSRGLLAPAEQLINLGANVNFKAIQAGYTAVDIASRFGHEECVDLLQSYVAGNEREKCDEPSAAELSPHDSILLEAYHHSIDDDKVNSDLIIALIKHIKRSTESTGAVLVFLPGYDDIVAVREQLLGNEAEFGSSRAVVYPLHSQLQTTDQCKVFKKPPHGVRKIILATNIAETSITIDDVVYVIDCGKVKERSFDAFSNISMLKCNWISQASAKQRAGRAGRCRPGIAYHLFSSSRCKTLARFQVAEILRSPLQELCLQTKLLAPPGVQIADFLMQAPDPPSFLIIRNAIQLLKQMDALDSFEDLTELGHHLVDIPIEPRLAKMIINSVILKCLDPILTIACTLAYKEPFMLPVDPSLKRKAAKLRQKFSADSHSDHMAYLRVFQAWQKARSEGYERSFCRSNFVSSPTMDMILGMRSLLLGQLRASGFVKARGSGDIRDLNTNSDSWVVVKAALTAGTYPNLLRVDRNKSELRTSKENKVRFHQVSVLSPSLGKVCSTNNKQAVGALPADWVIYDELCRSQYNSFTPRSFATASARCATVVTPVTVMLFAGSSRLALEEEALSPSAAVFSSDSEEETGGPEQRKVTVAIDNWIRFRMDGDTASLLVHLRQKWHALVLRRLMNPSRQLSQSDEAIVRHMVSVLTSEEQACGLKQPSGIGQRPRPMSAMQYNVEVEQHTASVTADKEVKGQSSAQHGRKGKNSPDAGSSGSSARSSIANSPSSSPAPAAARTGQQLSRSCRYFVVKGKNSQTLNSSQARSIWVTSNSTAAKLDAALSQSQTVFIIFMVEGSGYFHGLATVSKRALAGLAADSRETTLTASFCINWLRRANIPFTQTQHLSNKWAQEQRMGGQMVSQSADGQELEPTVGEMLIKLWENGSQQVVGSPVTLLQRDA